MKTVIVFDTDDPEGMKNTVKVINHLATEYLKDEAYLASYQIPFGKIELIKQFRNYGMLAKEGDFGGLRHAKSFVEKIIKDKTPF
tara:strand:+ start:645 stop:899 length:255 start_codon:yes stop_codon:yes gene_type:complete